MPIQIETIDGFRLGMNLAKPINDLQNTEARYLQDFFLDEETLLTQRGPVTGTTLSAARPVGAVGAATPTGSPVRVLDLDWADTTTGNSVLSIRTVSGTGLNIHTSYTFSLSATLFDAKPALNGGTFLGMSNATSSSSATAQRLFLYKGASAASATAGTVSVTRGGTAVTGVGTSFASSMVGAFLAATDDDTGTLVLIGEISAVGSTTSLTLKEKSPYTVTAKAYRIDSVRGFTPRVAKGRITTSTTSTTVTGASTKFKDQGLDTGTWNLFSKDMTFIGKVSSVATNTGLTLTANAAVALNNDRFYAIKTQTYQVPTAVTLSNTGAPGWLNATYAGRQWYANDSTVYFSETFHPEAVDLSAVDGDFIPLPTSQGIESPIHAIMPTQNCLLCLKEGDVQGIFGSTPSTFQLKKLGDDGTIHLGSVRPHEGGVLWAGRKGIYYYDGTQIENITSESLGEWYVRAVERFSSTSAAYFMGSAIVNGHYFLYIDTVQPPRGVKKGAVDTIPIRLTICVNLKNRAVTLHSNMAIHGAAEVRGANLSGTLLYLHGASPDGMAWMRGENLFEQTGRDGFICFSQNGGPRPYLETKKFDMGDPQMKKLFKQVQAHHKIVNDSLTLETVTGLQETGSVSLTTLPATGTGVFRNKRIKFLKRSQYLAFRLYPTNNFSNELVIGPMAVGFKWQRPGRP